MKSWYCVLALGLAPFSARAQSLVGSCADLPSTIDEDAEIELTAPTISCGTNTDVVVSDGARVTLTSAETETKLENVRFVVNDGATFACEVPNLEWTSVELDEEKGGAALRIYFGGSASFSEDVTFTGCSIEGTRDESGGAVTNEGQLTFAKTASFTNTIEGGALYNSGEIAFEGDATFTDNTFLAPGVSRDDVQNLGGGNGGAIHNERGTITFEGSASFVGNEAREIITFESEGVFHSGGWGGAVYSTGWDNEETGIHFKGPVYVSSNKGQDGAGFYLGGQGFIFESLVTFEDNEATSDGDDSLGGAMHARSGAIVEFQAGVIATGNIAKNGGGFAVDYGSDVTITGPVTITNNEARYQGGAIYNKGNVVLPADADISSNTAVLCPGVKNSDNNMDDAFTSYQSEPASFEFTGGDSYSGGSEELCYLGADEASSTSTSMELESDCELIASTASRIGAYPTLLLDTREVSSVVLQGTGDLEFNCPEQLIIFVSGGGELLITTMAESTTFSNVTFEVIGFTTLVLEVPEMTMAGIERSVVGGAMFVERGSRLDVMNQISFLGNTLAYLTDAAWEERGGGAMFSSGDVTFHERAYFIGNGQYEQDGLEAINQPGGAIVNIGTMEFMKKGTFMDNFDVNGGNGGGIANGGTLTFNLRAIFRNNSVELSFSDDGETYNGHGPGIYNLGGSSTILFKRLALFKDNVGGFRGCALAANGGTERDDNIGEGNNRVTFEGKAKFKDNFCEGDAGHNDTGGAALWVYGASTVEFQDKAVFKRNIAINGGAVMNAGTISFASADELVMADNVGSESCPDIKNYDKDLADHEYAEFGDINDPDGVCSCCGSDRSCTWYEGTLSIGTVTYVGESEEICELP